MRAEAGAINKITIEKESLGCDYSVIGKGKPKGICGSAMIDLLSELYDKGYQSKGRFLPRILIPVCGPMAKSRNSSLLANETDSGKDIVITERDLDNLIRAKPLFMRCEHPVEITGDQPCHIERVYIAAICSFIPMEKAIASVCCPIFH